MNWYKYSINIKTGLFLIGMVLVLSFVLFTQRIVEDLREDNRKIVHLYAEIIASVASEENDASLNFIFENIIQKVSFPLIQSDSEKYPISWKNLPENIDDPKAANDILRTMDKQNEPIPLIYIDEDTNEEHIFGYLHFGDSLLIKRLEMLPYIQIGLVGLFILIGFVGFNVIRNSEKKHIWAGMARETAHQLGTPVSALMGWVDLLQNNPKDANSILEEIELDLKRLGDISNRFSDMGSKPKKQEFNLKTAIEEVILYLQHRTADAEINFTHKKSDDLKYIGNKRLLSWAIENIVKNGIDAAKGKTAEININLKKEDQTILIDITDNGKGIQRRDWKNIFRPGFSTKKYGWGLGLSLVKRIINDFHDGKVFVKESQFKKGSTISIILR